MSSVILTTYLGNLNWPLYILFFTLFPLKHTIYDLEVRVLFFLANSDKRRRIQADQFENGL